MDVAVDPPMMQPPASDTCVVSKVTDDVTMMMSGGGDAGEDVDGAVSGRLTNGEACVTDPVPDVIDLDEDISKSTITTAGHSQPVDCNASDEGMDTGLDTVPVDCNASDKGMDTGLDSVTVDCNASDKGMDTGLDTVPVDCNASGKGMDTGLDTVSESPETTSEITANVTKVVSDDPRTVLVISPLDESDNQEASASLPPSSFTNGEELNTVSSCTNGEELNTVSSCTNGEELNTDRLPGKESDKDENVDNSNSGNNDITIIQNDNFSQPNSPESSEGCGDLVIDESPHRVAAAVTQQQNETSQNNNQDSQSSDSAQVSQDSSILGGLLNTKPKSAPTIVSSGSLKTVVNAMMDYGMESGDPVAEATVSSPVSVASSVHDDSTQAASRSISPVRRVLDEVCDPPRSDNLLDYLGQTVLADKSDKGSTTKIKITPSSATILDGGGSPHVISASEKNKLLGKLLSMLPPALSSLPQRDMTSGPQSPASSASSLTPTTVAQKSLPEPESQSDDLPMISEVYGGITKSNLVDLHNHGSMDLNSKSNSMEGTGPAQEANATASSILTEILKRTNTSGLAAGTANMSTPNLISDSVIVISPSVQDGKSPDTAIFADDHIEKPRSQSPIIIKEEKADAEFDKAYHVTNMKVAKQPPRLMPKLSTATTTTSTGSAVNLETVFTINNGRLVRMSSENISRSGSTLYVQNQNISKSGSTLYVQSGPVAGRGVTAARERFQQVVGAPGSRFISAPAPRPLRAPRIIGPSDVHKKPVMRAGSNFIRPATTMVLTSTGNLQLAPGNLQLAPGNLQLAPGNLQLAPGNLQLAPGNLQLAPSNVQVAVPLLLNKSVPSQPNQSRMIFTLAPVQQVSSKSGPTVTIIPASTPSVPTGVVQTKGLTPPKTPTPVDKQKTNDYKKLINIMTNLLETNPDHKDLDLKYSCLAAPASLMLDSRFSRLYVCRGCDSMFHKQQSLSEHQLRRTMTLRYSCRENCHVLFYNFCQLRLHMRTHTAGRNWDDNVDISALAEALVRELGDSKGETYDEIKKKTYEATLAGRTILNRKRKLSVGSANIDKTAADSPLCISPDTQEENLDEKEKVDADEEAPSLASPGKIGEETTPRVNTYSNGEPVVCPECGKSFKARALLVQHMIFNKSRELYFCKTCPVVLKSKCGLSAHIRIHKNMVPYVCPECGQVIHGSHKVFWKHLHVKCAHHIRQALYMCVVQNCMVAFKEKKKLCNHLKTAHSTTFHKCQLCPMAFKTDETFKQHCSKAHNGQISRKVIHKCPMCDAVYNDTNFSAHMETHETPVKVVHKCNACNEMFDEHKDCLSHMGRVHKFYFNTNEMCHVCGVELGTAATLYKHQLKCHPSIKQLDEALTKSLIRAGKIQGDSEADLSDTKEPSPKKMRISPSPQLSELLSGIKAEANAAEGEESLFTCHRCQTKFDDSATYQRHMAKHRFIEKKRLLAKSTTEESEQNGTSNRDDELVLKIKLPKLKSQKKAKKQREELSEEPKVFTKQVPGAPDPEPQYLCSECNLGFYLEKHLNDHLKQEHDLERQFPCHLCGKTYKDQVTLKAHIKKRHEGSTKERPFACWICKEKDIERSFSKKNFLVKHLSKEHKISRNNIDYSKMPEGKETGTGKAQSRDASPRRASLDSMEVDADQDLTSEHGNDTVQTDIPAVKRLKLEGESNFSCAKCSFTTEDREAFLAHIPKHQTNKLQGMKQCLECGLIFTVIPSLKKHLFVVHQIHNFTKYLKDSGLDLVSQPEEQDVILPKNTVNPQPDRIWRPRGLAEPKQYVHKRAQEEPEAVYGNECKVCYKLYDSETELRTHMRTHGMAFIRSKRFDST